MREKMIRRDGVRLVWMATIMGLTLATAACGPSVNGVDQVGKARLGVDIYGCPDLSGTYAFPPPGAKGVSYQGSMLESFTSEDGAQVPASQIRAVSIRRLAPGAFEFRFMIDDTRVMQHLGVIREYQKPRYREWYHLLHDPGRAAFIRRNGADVHARQLLALGPKSEIARELRAGTTATCRKGWLELSRPYADPIRLTLGEDGSILGESDELTTLDIPIWCGDGCKDLKIPTGTYTGTLRWPRNDALRPWRADDMATRFAFERPIDEIEAEVRAREDQQRRSDTRRYLSAGEIRARLTALAPAGTVVDTVEVRGGKVHIRYTAPEAQMDGLLDRVEDAGGISVSHAPQEVRRIVTSGRFHQRSVEFVLTDSPLVRRDIPRSSQFPAGTVPAATVTPIEGAAEAAADAADKTADQPAARMAVLSEAPPDPTTLQPPAGVADPSTIQRRAAKLFPAGCRIVDVRFRGDLVTLTGQAEQHRCVSEGLRALDGLGSRPELQSIEGDARGGYRFRVAIAASSLTRR